MINFFFFFIIKKPLAQKRFLFFKKKCTAAWQKYKTKNWAPNIISISSTKSTSFLINYLLSSFNWSFKILSKTCAKSAETAFICYWQKKFPRQEIPYQHFLFITEKNVEAVRISNMKYVCSNWQEDVRNICKQWLKIPRSYHSPTQIQIKC